MPRPDLANTSVVSFSTVCSEQASQRLLLIDPSQTSDEPSSEASRPGGLSKNAGVAIGVVVGVFSAMALGIVVWCFRRRQRRVTEERRRRKRMDFVIS